MKKCGMVFVAAAVVFGVLFPAVVALSQTFAFGIRFPRTPTVAELISSAAMVDPEEFRRSAVEHSSDLYPMIFGVAETAVCGQIAVDLPLEPFIEIGAFRVVDLIIPDITYSPSDGKNFIDIVLLDFTSDGAERANVSCGRPWRVVMTLRDYPGEVGALVAGLRSADIRITFSTFVFPSADLLGRVNLILSPTGVAFSPRERIVSAEEFADVLRANAQ